ncbi:MAG: Rho termination factor N-terminal domain-containing protein, partial [Bacteroidales bacterium]|nr:Rho termination factor N-terminal domain-containing protein [Bacteroidales bacterium]
MLDIIELNSKRQEELVAIAKELNVRKPESLDKDTLIYAILDEQAIQSKESPAKRQRKKAAAKKNEAKEKEKPAAEPAAAPEAEAQKPTEAPAPAQEKRKRGRPRKNAQPEV